MQKIKKIGLLFGLENSFPQAVIENINNRGLMDIIAESMLVDEVIQGEDNNYSVIIDRISHEIPFYRSYLKNAIMSGTTVINNPFWWSADDKFFNNAVATKLGIPVPKTILLPAKQQNFNTISASYKNLKFPMDWEKCFSHIGFPAYLKPYNGGGWRNVFKIKDENDFFEKYNNSGTEVMMLQEEIIYEDYFRCYCIGRKEVKIMEYEPQNPYHLRYINSNEPISFDLKQTLINYTLALNNELGYDFNSVEYAIRNGIAYAIDFFNPVPDADLLNVGLNNFNWVVEKISDFAIKKAQNESINFNNITWGNFVKG